MRITTASPLLLLLAPPPPVHRAPPPLARVAVRLARCDELRLPSTSDRSIFTPLALLTADCLFAQSFSNDDERTQLVQEMNRNLQERYSSRNPRRNALIVAFDTRSNKLVGSCGVEAAPLTPEGRASPRLPTDAARMAVRPLLSNLVVHHDYRRRGVATRLMREAEARARDWGFEALLLKVEAGN